MKYIKYVMCGIFAILNNKSTFDNSKMENAFHKLSFPVIFRSFFMVADSDSVWWVDVVRAIF